MLPGNSQYSLIIWKKNPQESVLKQIAVFSVQNRIYEFEFALSPYPIYPRQQTAILFNTWELYFNL